jgi:hypothetical protein
MKLIEGADIVIVLPGGPGTFDELWEVSVYRTLGLRGMQHIPVCLVNIDNYFEHTIAQLKRAEEEGLLYNNCDGYFHVESDVEKALQWSLSESDSLQQAKQSGVSKEAWANAEGGMLH